MKVIQHILQRTFHVVENSKEYWVDFINSDGQILALINRSYWEVSELETREEVRDDKLKEELISFCIAHFNDYDGDYK